MTKPHKRRPVDRNRLKQRDSQQIEADLIRVRQRAGARLGTGISQRAVEGMLSKLDDQTDEENTGGD